MSGTRITDTIRFLVLFTGSGIVPPSPSGAPKDSSCRPICSPSEPLPHPRRALSFPDRDSWTGVGFQGRRPLSDLVNHHRDLLLPGREPPLHVAPEVQEQLQVHPVQRFHEERACVSK